MNIEYKDMHITPTELLELAARVYQDTNVSPGLDEKGHPEDVYYALDLVFNSLGKGLIHYIEMIKINANNREGKNV
jgi:hypothetical protein